MNKNPEQSRTSRFCYQLYCEQPLVPFFSFLFILLLGTSFGWFLFDYIHLHAFGLYSIWCINGINIHHLYVGIGMVLVFLPLVWVYLRKNIVIVLILTLLLGFGFGLILSDVFSHFIIQDEIFSVYC